MNRMVDRMSQMGVRMSRMVGRMSWTDDGVRRTMWMVVEVE